MNRTDLQALALERIADAEALLAAGRWAGAYYLAGYAVECALKACIAKRTNLHDFPDREATLRAYTHKLDALVEVAGLEADRAQDVRSHEPRRLSWTVLKDWNEGARYQRWTEDRARGIFAAVSDVTKGVLPWIMDRW